MEISLKHRALKVLTRVLSNLLRRISTDLYLRIAIGFRTELDTVLEVPTPNGPLLFQCASHTVHTRARQLHHREPDTLRWIEGFEPGSVFWDIGSNIGVFSLYAAHVPGAMVVAFDPLADNFSTLNRNVTLNGLHEKVMAFCAAISAETKVARLYVPEVADTAGGAGCPFDAKKNNYDREVSSIYDVAVTGYSVDDFLERFDVPFPNYIKADIDGPPDPVIKGALKTLSDPRLESVMLELQPTNIRRNRESWDFIMRTLSDAGLNHIKSARCTPNMENDPVNYPTNNFFARRT